MLEFVDVVTVPMIKSDKIKLLNSDKMLFFCHWRTVTNFVGT